jgi:hypothetical protein
MAYRLGLAPTLNPLRVGGTLLPVPVLLIAKLVTVYAFVNIWRYLPEPFLPFVPFFDQLGAPLIVQRVLQAAFLIAATALLTNQWVRTACLTLSLVIVLKLLSNRLLFANNEFFAACLLLLAGLTGPGQRPRLLQLQVALLYCGASFNKLLDADWRSGQFFANWMEHIPGYWHESLLHGMLLQINAWLPPGLLWLLLGWGTIAVELSLGVGFLVRRLTPFAIVAGLCFHTTLVALAGKTYGFFFWAPISYLAFVE